MSTTQFQTVYEQAMGLSADDRELLIHRLEASIHETDPALEKAWLEEVERRIDEYDSGQVKVVDGEPVLKRLLEGRRP